MAQEKADEDEDVKRDFLALEPGDQASNKQRVDQQTLATDVLG